MGGRFPKRDVFVEVIAQILEAGRLIHTAKTARPFCFFVLKPLAKGFRLLVGNNIGEKYDRQATVLAGSV